MTVEHLTVQMLQDIVASAVTVECAKATHNNQFSPNRQVNAQVSHWYIANIAVNGKPIGLFAQFHGLNLEMLIPSVKNRYNTKKEAFAAVVETFADALSGIVPSWNTTQDDDDCFAEIIESLKAVK